MSDASTWFMTATPWNCMRKRRHGVDEFCMPHEPSHPDASGVLMLRTPSGGAVAGPPTLQIPPRRISGATYGLHRGMAMPILLNVLVDEGRPDGESRYQ